MHLQFFYIVFFQLNKRLFSPIYLIIEDFFLSLNILSRLVLVNPVSCLVG